MKPKPPTQTRNLKTVRQASREVIRGLAWWLGVAPVAFLVQCRLACLLQRKSNCEPLLNLLPLLASVVVIFTALLLEQLLFEHQFVHGDGHVVNMVLLAAALLPLAWLLYRYVGAGPVVRAPTHS